MKFHATLVPIVTLAAFFLTCGSTSASPPVKAIHLKQEHCYFGKSEVWISKTGFRYNSDPKQGFSIIAIPPDWTVNVFRQSEKKIYSQPLEQFTQTGLISNILLRFRERNEMLEQPAIEGKCGSFTTIKRQWKKDFIEYIPGNDELPLGARSVIYGLYKVPTNGGIPLRYVLPGIKRDAFNFTDTKRANRIILRTESVERTSVSPSLFITPSNFQRVKFAGEVINGHATEEDLRDLTDEPGKPRP